MQITPKATTMAMRGRYITWGEKIDDAKLEVARAKAIVAQRPAAIERLEMALAELTRLETAMRDKGKRRSHIARSNYWEQGPQ